MEGGPRNSPRGASRRRRGACRGCRGSPPSSRRRKSRRRSNTGSTTEESAGEERGNEYGEKMNVLLIRKRFRRENVALFFRFLEGRRRTFRVTRRLKEPCRRAILELGKSFPLSLLLPDCSETEEPKPALAICSFERSWGKM